MTTIMFHRLHAAVAANAATRDMVEPHAAALDACHAAMAAAGIGTHPTNGHVHVLRRMADSMRAEAAMGKVPSAWRDHDYPVYAAADDGNAAAKRPVTFIPQNLNAAALADILDRLNMPLPPAVKALAASGMPYGATGHKISLAELDKRLSATSLTTADRIKVKFATEQNGLLASTDRRISNQARL
ncbi:hypothetical protein [Bradyrhizobium genosp. P]|uniref:hypothetical protein n=1 Tax=Bradyrhizobium genosp. P TaxID=83641 RepID=UPI003CE8CE6A